MLRVGGPPKPKEEEALPLPEETAPEVPTEIPPAAMLPDMAEESLGSYPSKKVPQPLVVYMTSDMGPFECAHCTYFEAPSSCGIVDGDIDPKGCCNLYEPPDATPEEVPNENQPIPV